MIDPRAAALEDCLQRLQAGASLSEVLARYPQWAADLRPRLEAAQAAQALGETLQVPRAVVARGRARFLKQIHQPVQPRLQPALQRVTWLRASLAALLVLMIAFSGVALASAQALPGDAFYPIKLAVEQTRLRLTRAVPQRLALEAEFDRERLQETRAVLDRQRTGPVTLIGVLTQTAPEAWQVADIPVVLSPTLVALGQTFSGFQVVAEGLAQPDGRIMLEALRLREFQLTGPLESFTTEEWIISGVVVALAPETIIQGTPVVGQRVVVQAVRRANDILVAQTLIVIDSSSTTPTPGPLLSPSASLSPTAPPTATPIVTLTEAPLVTPTPIDSTQPGQTPTVQPEVTATATLTPPASRTPLPSNTPRPSATPEPSESPESTQAPEPTQAPESTESPEPTERPEPSGTP